MFFKDGDEARRISYRDSYRDINEHDPVCKHGKLHWQHDRDVLVSRMRSMSILRSLVEV